jgi:DNA polymerase/3'-5' exonuclease PolX
VKGLWTKDGEYVAGKTEEEVYAALGLAWLDPQER